MTGGSCFLAGDEGGLAAAVGSSGAAAGLGRPKFGAGFDLKGVAKNV